MLVFLVLAVFVHLSVFYPYGQALTNIDVTCPPNWTQHPSYKNACYRLGTTAGNFTSATAGCEAFLNGSTVANVYNLEIHNFLADGLLTLGHEYYTGLKQVKGESVFTELNNELLGTWNKWGTVTGGTCTVYSNEEGEWVWHTNTCDQPGLYICEYIVPTPGQLPLVLLPVDSVPLSGRLEIFINNMWGGFRDSGPKETVGVVCQDLGYLPDIGESCAGATCGTGKIWYDKVKCNVDSANMSECLDGTKLYTSDDHSKDTIIRCKDITTTPIIITEHSTALLDTTTVVDTTTFVDTSTAEDTTTAEHTTTAEDTTTTENTTTAEDTTTPQNVVTTDPITPQNNVSVIYHNVTTTVNVTVTEFTTVFATTTLWVTTSAACSFSSLIDATLTSTSSSSSSVMSSSTLTSTTTTTTKIELDYKALPVMKSKNSAKYSTKTRQDDRPSAQVIGSFGIFIVVGILASIVALDLGTLGKEVSRICKKRNRKKSADPNKSDTALEIARISPSSIRSLTNISINTLAKKSYVNTNWRD